MPAFNQSIMLPGLIVVTALFWAWIPVWALIRCMRRAKGPLSDEEKLKTGTIPYKGVVSPEDSNCPPLHISQPQRVASATMETGQHQSPKAVQMKVPREDDGIRTEEAPIQKEEEERAAAMRQQKGNARYERRERRETREQEAEARRGEQGKDRALPVSGESSLTISEAVTTPENVLTRGTSKQHTSRR